MHYSLTRQHWGLSPALWNRVFILSKVSSSIACARLPSYVPARIAQKVFAHCHSDPIA